MNTDVAMREGGWLVSMLCVRATGLDVQLG